MLVAPRWLIHLLSVCVVALLADKLPEAHAELEVVVPAYFYPVPNSPWDDLNVATSQVDITAIMNPGSGPGLGQDSNYVAAVDSLRAAGGKVIGYVHTTWGTRNLATVLSEIDDYASWYNIDGIFIDEMATGIGQINYYSQVYDHIKSINANWELMGNPGTNTSELYLTHPAADRLVISENVGSLYPGFSPAAWVSNHERSNFVHLIHSESSATTMQDDLTLAISRNAGAIFITDDLLPNPWDVLPTYWQTELDAIEQLNTSILAGDMDEDLDVDSDDLARWISGFGITIGATHYDGDADADGDVDGNDFLEWQRQFGSTSLATAASTTLAVPEPGSFFLLLTATGIRLLVRVCHRVW